MLLRIVPRVCTLVLFIDTVLYIVLLSAVVSCVYKKGKESDCCLFRSDNTHTFIVLKKAQTVQFETASFKVS